MILTDDMRLAMSVARNYKRMQDATENASNAIRVVKGNAVVDHFMTEEQKEILNKAQEVLTTIHELSSEYNAEVYLKNLV